MKLNIVVTAALLIAVSSLARAEDFALNAVSARNLDKAALGGAAYAAGFGKYPVCQQTAAARIDARCVCSAEVAVNGDEPAAQVACADSAPGTGGIQQCIGAVKAMLNNSIDEAHRTRIAAVACSGGSERLTMQSCMYRAQAVLSANDTEAGRAMAAAIACSGGTDHLYVQYCLSSAHAVTNSPSPWEQDLSAAFACSGYNSDSAPVQSCIGSGGFEIQEKSRFQLIKDLIGAE